MNTIARRASLRIADRTAPLAQLVINARFAAIVASLIAETAADEDLDTCDLCELAAAELFTRTDNRDGQLIEVCEDCADHGDVSYADADIYA